MSRLETIKIRDTFVSRSDLARAEQSARAQGRPLPGLYALAAERFRVADMYLPRGKRLFRRAA